MARTTLGLSAFYHDSAAAIVRDGEILAAAQEERFSRKKHDPRFPHLAINYCLEEAYLEPSELDAIVFYDNPLLTWDRVIKSCLQTGEKSLEQFEKAAPSILGVKSWVQAHVMRSIGTLGKAGKLLFTEHHMAHAASAFYPSPFEDAAIVTLDGVGEWATTTVGHGSGNAIRLIHEIDYPHSIGLLYSAFTYYCGFKVNSGEYKLMGLAPYGTPRYYDTIRAHLIDVREDGSYRLNTDYFGYLDSLVMCNDRFSELFGGPPRVPGSTITARHMDLAASVQKVTEEVVVKIARFARKETGSRNLVLAGGVALNCVANGKILKERIFDQLWIQPAAGDAGGALGAALMVSHAYFGVPRTVDHDGRDRLKGSYLGPAYSPHEIQAFLERNDYPYERIQDSALRARLIAKSIAEGKIVGYLSGRMEYGPRALGARSILGDPRRADTQSVMNLKIKFRESFRPFAPAVLAEDVSTIFDLDTESPYMLIVAPVREDRQLPRKSTGDLDADGGILTLVNQARSDLPAITHVDYSARIQSVTRESHAGFHDILTEFKALTRTGAVVNTSFNVRGEPIVCSPQDAYQCFMRTGMDLLVLEDFVLRKELQPPYKESGDWRQDHELD